MLAADPGGGAGAAFAGIGSAVSDIVAAANSGFGISENGGQALMHAIDDLSKAVEAALGRALYLGVDPALGTTPAAIVYKPFLATIATDPTQGAIPVLKKLQKDLTNARAAIQKAMQNYQATEQANASSAKGIWT
jgi:hypothetical protein